MQHNATKYFALARTEEMAGHDAPAIFYLASFCASLNCYDTQTLYRTTSPKFKGYRLVSLYLMNP